MPEHLILVEEGGQPGVRVNLVQLTESDLPKLAELAEACDGRLFGAALGRGSLRAGRLTGRTLTFDSYKEYTNSRERMRTIVITVADELPDIVIPDLNANKRWYRRTQHDPGGHLCLLEGDLQRWGTWLPDETPQDAPIDAPNSVISRIAALFRGWRNLEDLRLTAGIELQRELYSAATRKLESANGVASTVELGYGQVGKTDARYDLDRLWITRRGDDVESVVLRGNMDPDTAKTYIALREADMPVEDAEEAAHIMSAADNGDGDEDDVSDI